MKKILHKWIERYFGTEEALLLTIILVVSLVVFATLGAVLGPVFAALILSFLLQGVVNALVRYGVPRAMPLRDSSASQLWRSSSTKAAPNVSMV